MKRSNGEGTIFKRNDGRWCAAYYDNSEFPKRHFVYGKTQAEVKAKLKEKRENTDLLGVENKGKYTLQEWVEFFLLNYKKNEIKQTTLGTYMETYEKHIKDSKIGGILLNKLTSNHMQIYYNQKREVGYNAKTIKHIHTIINSSLEKAVQLKFIHANVNKAVSLPKKQIYEAQVLSSEEVKKILDTAKADELYPIIIFTIYTGLRKGEVMALKWKNIDFEKREVTIEGSLCRVPGERDAHGTRHYAYEIMEPKTQKSKRTIPLLDIAVEALLLQKERQEQIKERNKVLYVDEDFVFARYDGRYLNQRAFMDDYHAFLKRYKVSDVRFHDLRHTFASLLLDAGESPKIIQELLGHSTITTTMDIYAHVTKQGKLKTVERLNDIL